MSRQSRGASSERDRASVKQMVPPSYEYTMVQLKDVLSQLLGIELKADAGVGRGGMLEGRVFVENPHFGAEFRIVSVRGVALGRTRWYEATIRTENLPGVNEFSKYFPLTASNRTLKAVAQAIRETLGRLESLPVVIPLDRGLAISAGFPVGAVGVASGLFAGMWAYLATGTEAGLLTGLVIGALSGVGVMLLLTLRLFD